MERNQLQALIEAVLLTSRGPLTAATVAEALDAEDISEQQIEGMLEDLRADFEQPHRGVRLEKVAGGWRCVTPPQLDPYLRALHGVQGRQHLSQAALEVLALVAHRQPITLPEINFIRATNSSAVVRTLMDRKLVRVSGRKKVVGKPFIYRTTKEFLVHFGLERIEDLPEPEEFEESMVPAD